MDMVPDLPDDVWYLILEGLDDNASVLCARRVSRTFHEMLRDTFDAVRLIRNIRREYQPRWRPSMERMGLLRFTRSKHTCTEKEKRLLTTMLRRCSDTRITAYTRHDFFVIDLTERSILRNLILPLYQQGTTQLCT